MVPRPFDGPVVFVSHQYGAKSYPLNAYSGSRFRPLVAVRHGRRADVAGTSRRPLATPVELTLRAAHHHRLAVGDAGRLTASSWVHDDLDLSHPGSPAASSGGATCRRGTSTERRRLRSCSSGELVDEELRSASRQPPSQRDVVVHPLRTGQLVRRLDPALRRPARRSVHRPRNGQLREHGVVGEVITGHEGQFVAEADVRARPGPTTSSVDHPPVRPPAVCAAVPWATACPRGSRLRGSSS